VILWSGIFEGEMTRGLDKQTNVTAVISNGQLHQDNIDKYVPVDDRAARLLSSSCRLHAVGNDQHDF